MVQVPDGWGWGQLCSFAPRREHPTSAVLEGGNSISKRGLSQLVGQMLTAPVIIGYQLWGLVVMFSLRGPRPKVVHRLPCGRLQQAHRLLFRGGGEAIGSFLKNWQVKPLGASRCHLGAMTSCPLWVGTRDTCSLKFPLGLLHSLSSPTGPRGLVFGAPPVQARF